MGVTPPALRKKKKMNNNKCTVCNEANTEKNSTLCKSCKLFSQKCRNCGASNTAKATACKKCKSHRLESNPQVKYCTDCRAMNLALTKECSCGCTEFSEVSFFNDELKVDTRDLSHPKHRTRNAKSKQKEGFKPITERHSLNAWKRRNRAKKRLVQVVRKSDNSLAS